MKHVLVSCLACLVAATATAGFLPEHSIPAHQPMSWSGPLATAAFDGVHYVLLYTDSAQLKVQRIDEAGDLAGSAWLLDAMPVLDPHVASAHGLSLALWAQSGSRGRLAWIPADGPPTPSFGIAGASSVAAVGDHFLVGWSDRNGGYVSRIEPFATSVTSTFKVTDSTGAIRLASAGENVLAMWIVQGGMQPCFMEVCPLIAQVRLLTTDGAPAGKIMARPQLADATMPTDADALFIGLDRGSVIGRSANGLQRWIVPNADSLARLSGRLYAAGVPHGCTSPCAARTSFGPVGPDAHLAAEHRFAGTWDGSYSMDPALAAGSRSLLVYFVNALAQAIQYQIADVATPFPPLPPSPNSLAVSLSSSEPTATATLQWTPAASSGEQLVQAEPLSDPTIFGVLRSLPADASTASFQNLPADVVYAFRVFSSSPEGLSKPAESIQRTQPTPLPRAAADFTAVVDGRFATFAWHDQSTNERGFRISAVGDSGDRIVADVPANTTAVTVGLLPGSNFYFLESYNSLGRSMSFIYWDLFASVPRLRAVGH